MHAVKSTHNKVVDHVHHRLGHRIVDALESVHTLLHQHIRDLHTVLDYGHLVSLLAIEAPHLAGILDCHDTHPIGARVGLDDDKWGLLYAVLRVLCTHLL